MRAKFGEIGDARLTAIAAITVADELVEAGPRVKRLEEELAALQDARTAIIPQQGAQASIAAALSAAAERIESITKKLNQTIGASGVALG